MDDLPFVNWVALNYCYHYYDNFSLVKAHHELDYLKKKTFIEFIILCLFQFKYDKIVHAPGLEIMKFVQKNG